MHSLILHVGQMANQSTMHFIATCVDVRCFPALLPEAHAEDIFIGSPPLAFTFAWAACSLSAAVGGDACGKLTP